MNLVTYIGFLAATCTTGSLLPQLLKLIKTKRAKDLSLGMYLFLSFGVSCWLIYGILQEDIVIISANIISLIMDLSIVGLKLKYD